MLLTSPGLYGAVFIYLCFDCMLLKSFKSSTKWKVSLFCLFCLFFQGGVHLSLRHDAGSGLHWKAPTQKPWISSKDLFLWPLPDLYGGCATLYFWTGSLDAKLYTLDFGFQSHLFDFWSRWLPASTCMMKGKKRRCSMTSGEQLESWMSKLSTTWRWASWTPLWVCGCACGVAFLWVFVETGLLYLLGVEPLHRP